MGLLVALLRSGLSAPSDSGALSDELGEPGGPDESVDTGADGALKIALAAVPTPAFGADAVVVSVIVSIAAPAVLFPAFPVPLLGPNKKFLACSLPAVKVFLVVLSVPLALASLSLSDPPVDGGSGGDVESSLCGDSRVASRKISLSRLKLRSVPVAAARVTSGGSIWPRNLSAGVKGAAVAGRRLVVVGGMRGGRAGDSCSGAADAARLFLAAGEARGGRAGDSGAGARWGEG